MTLRPDQVFDPAGTAQIEKIVCQEARFTSYLGGHGFVQCSEPSQSVNSIPMHWKLPWPHQISYTGLNAESSPFLASPGLPVKWIVLMLDDDDQYPASETAIVTIDFGTNAGKYRCTTGKTHDAIGQPEHVSAQGLERTNRSWASDLTGAKFPLLLPRTHVGR